MTKILNYIAVERETLMGDNGVPTYFVDVVTVLADGSKSHSNLRSTKDVHEARKIAREEADKNGCRVEDETLIIGGNYKLGAFA